jgi:tRNA(fMet)-specific endonuclease VapC
MAHVLDTSAAIKVRDGDPEALRRLSLLEGAVLLSVVTRVELEGGVYREAQYAPIRRARLDAMLAAMPTLPFDPDAAAIYGGIVPASGYSRRKLLDRMIAAQTLQHRAQLITCNRDDFADVPGLALIEW